MTLDQLTRAVDQQHGVYLGQEAHVAQLRATVATLTDSAQLLTLTDAALQTLLQDVSRENLAVIEGTITYGLRTVFPDRDLQFKFRVSQQRAGTSLEPLLVSGPVEQPILDAFGGGPATVVAFLLRLLVCHRLGLYRLMLLDETFSMVSRVYRPNVAALLAELAGRLGMTFVLVTHDESPFLAAADRAYAIQETADGTRFVPVSG